MENISKTGFKEYGLSQEVKEALAALGYNEPTQIQKEVIPVALKGLDIVAKSQTGTGKTAAFAIPICEKVQWEGNSPQALVLEPTRELAVQVQTEIFHIGRKKRLKVPALFGGFPIDKQLQTLRQKSHIVVGTPGRIMDHARRGSMEFGQIQYLVIDEADLMFDMGFAEEVAQIIELLPSDRQILLFSATLDEKVQRLSEAYTKEAISIILESETETVEEVTQAVYVMQLEEKYKAFTQLLYQENPDSCMIFCGTREMVNVLFQKLRRDRIFCGMLHGEMEQKDRLKTIDAFQRGAFRYLIATDVAARGIDFANITHVMNYDFPTGKEAYVHRIGRTGRNGNSGKAISLVCENDKRMCSMVEEFIGMKIPVYPCPKVNEAQEKQFWASQRKKATPKARKGEELNRTITRLSVGGGRKSKMRAVDIVGTVCNIEGVDASDIGIIDVRDSLTYVEILNGKGDSVLEALQDKPVKGKIRKVRITRNIS